MSLTYKELFPEQGSFLINGSELVATVIYEAIKGKTWPTLPRKIDSISDNVRVLYMCEFTKMSPDFYYKAFATYDELHDWLKKHLLAIPEIEELNLSQREYDAGVGVNDEERDKYAFTSRWFDESLEIINVYSPAIPPDEDFIDLDAFVRNVCHDLIRSCVEINYSTFPSAPYHKEDGDEQP